MPQVKIFSGSASQYLAEKIAAAYGTSLGDVSISRFSDGEIGVHYNESVRGAEVFIVQSTFPPTDNLMELMLLVDAAKRASAHKVIVVMPYYGYARQDRKDKPRVSIGSKVVANAIQSCGADRLMTCAMTLFSPRRMWAVWSEHGLLPRTSAPRWWSATSTGSAPTRLPRCR